MAESTIPLTKRDLSIAIDDGSSLSFACGKMPGDFNYGAPGNGIVDILDNGRLTAPRLGDEQPYTFSWTQHLTDPGSDTYATIVDIVEWEARPTSYWNLNAVSTLDGESDVNACTVTVTIDLSKFGLADKSLVFEDAILRSGGADFGASATYKVTGRGATAMAPTLA